MKKRNEIPDADTWRLEDMVESDETWETLFPGQGRRFPDTGS